MTVVSEVIVSRDREGKASGKRVVAYITVIALLVLLPGLHSVLFGWLHFLLPLAVLFYLYRWESGLRFVLAGFAAAALISVFTGTLTVALFSAALIPAGYVLATSAFQGDSPALSGFKGGTALCLCWLALLIGQTLLSGVNPITDFLHSLDGDIENALRQYRHSESMSPEKLAMVEQTLVQMKTVLPKIIPAIMVCFSFFIIWATMVAGNRLISRHTSYRPWPDQRTWHLPDRLIWLFIGSGLAALVPVESIRWVGINGAICFGLIYFFQGFAILVFFMHKWNVPPLLRFLLYGMMLFQQFGTILLLIVGVSDVWLDLRRQKSTPD